MIDRGDVKFDSDYSCDINIDYLNTQIILYVSDALEASQQRLDEKYLDKIVAFLNSIDAWYPVAIRAVREWGVGTYGSGEGEVLLLSVHVLFEQNADFSLFGLQFRPEFDPEHGAGLKIRGDNFLVLETGSADVAFS